MEQIKSLIGNDVTAENVRKFVEKHPLTQTKTLVFDLLKITHRELRLKVDNFKFHLYLNGDKLVECDAYVDQERVFSYRSFLTDEPKNDTYNLLYVMDGTGHTKLHLDWDPKNKKDEQEMKQMFLDLKYKGYMIFEVKKTLGIFKRKGIELTEFNPEKKNWIAELANLKTVKAREIHNDSETSVDDAEFIDPETDEIKPNHKYIAAAPIAGG